MTFDIRSLSVIYLKIYSLNHNVMKHENYENISKFVIGEEYTILPTSDNFSSKRPALEKVDGLKKVNCS